MHCDSCRVQAPSSQGRLSWSFSPVARPRAGKREERRSILRPLVSPSSLAPWQQRRLISDCGFRISLLPEAPLSAFPPFPSPTTSDSPLTRRPVARQRRCSQTPSCLYRINTTLDRNLRSHPSLTAAPPSQRADDTGVLDGRLRWRAKITPLPEPPTCPRPRNPSRPTTT